MMMAAANGQMHSRNVTIRITRKPEDIDFDAICRMRDGCYYEDPADARYALGGIHQRRSAAELRAALEHDSTSQYLLAELADSTLAAYSRISLLTPSDSEFDPRLITNNGAASSARTMVIQILLVGDPHRGVRFVEGQHEDKLSALLLRRIEKLAELRECHTLLCDIAAAPVCNAPSKAFFVHRGFVLLGEAPMLRRPGGEVRFSRFVKLL